MKSLDQSHIRNFCIIAHIDHGKSTLADRFLDVCGTLTQKQMKAQVLDDMDIERERGITIKAHAIALDYKAKANGEVYRFHLIDTPGHVDFSYEVSRSLSACEGALLLVDASQGVEAQTVSNLFMAMEAGLEIIPIINKIDMPAAMVDDVRQQIKNLIGSTDEEILLASAKSGIGVVEILEAVVERVPPPSGDPTGPLRALIFDSEFDQYRGVVAHIRVVDGELRAGDEVRLISAKANYLTDEVGSFQLDMIKRDFLRAGDVGYLLASLKNVADAKVGDTITHKRSDVVPLPGFQPIKPMVFSGLFPIDTEDYVDLKDALAKLQLNDAALSFEPETSAALGFGFRCGFLGPLHIEIVQERVAREFNLDIIATVPNVALRVVRGNGQVIHVSSPAEMPEVQREDAIEEPFIDARIITPTDYTGPIMQLVQDRRGEFEGMTYLDPTRVQLNYKLPLSEIIWDFYDKLKSLSRGYATLDYEIHGYRASDLVRLTVMLNGEKVDALSIIVHTDKAYDRGRELVDKLRELIPRQQFQIAIQAAIGAKVIARSTVGALRKDVTAKCYGGDISRKRKLLEKQKEGKKRMKQIGTVSVPQEAFLALLKTNE